MSFVDDAKRKVSDRVSELLMLHKSWSQNVCEEFSRFSEDDVGKPISEAAQRWTVKDAIGCGKTC